MWDDPFRIQNVRSDVQSESEGVRKRNERERFWQTLPRNQVHGYAVPGQVFSGNPEHLTRGAKFRQSDLRGSDWSGCQFGPSGIEKSQFQNSLMTGANFTNCSFARATFYFVRAEGANFQEASFEEARLERVDLRGANLTGVNFKGTFLKSVDLRGADLTGARGLDLVIFDSPGPRTPGQPWNPHQVQWDNDTRWPDGFSPLGTSQVTVIAVAEEMETPIDSRCSICLSPFREEIEAKLGAKKSLRALEAEYGVSRSALSRHTAHARSQ